MAKDSEHREDGQQSSTRGSGALCLDWQGALKKLEGDKQLLMELAEMFLQQSPELLAAIDQALAKKDAPELRRAAHTLKSSAKVVGADATAEAALVLENLSRDNQLASAGAAIELLQAKIAELKPVLAAALRNNAATEGGS
ncbi:MAG: Hpt domain-containing protein [Porticoccaceae bacterium]